MCLRKMLIVLKRIKLFAETLLVNDTIICAL